MFLLVVYQRWVSRMIMMMLMVIVVKRSAQEIKQSYGKTKTEWAGFASNKTLCRSGRYPLVHTSTATDELIEKNTVRLHKIYLSLLIQPSLSCCENQNLIHLCMCVCTWLEVNIFFWCLTTLIKQGLYILSASIREINKNKSDVSWSSFPLWNKTRCIYGMQKLPSFMRKAEKT